VPKPAQVDVWRIALGAPLTPDSDATLDAAERTRADRFHFDRDRRRFIRSHDALRRILARYQDAEPSALRFLAASNGKPYLPDRSLHFNLSHSADHALVAVSLDCPVGVDVEIERELDYLPAARLVFHADELVQLETQSGPALREDFFHCWVRREAFLKGLGLGIGAAKGLEPVWRRGQLQTTPRQGWRVVGLNASPGARAALAAAAEEVEWTEQDWPG